jgi:hypothetical protein
MTEQRWEGFEPVGEWSATVTLFKDGLPMGQFDLLRVEVVESASGDLNPEDGLPVEQPHTLALKGVIKE